MKILVIGATGTIGSVVVAALGHQHEIIAASRTGAIRIDIDDPASIRAAFDTQSQLDAVVVCAGGGAFAPLAKLTDEDFATSIRSKLMGQVNVVRAALPKLVDGGSITLTSGSLAHEPSPGSAAISLINAGLEGFARAAALEAPRKIRVNVVSPPWITETLTRLKMDAAKGMPAADVAPAYLHAIMGTGTGEVLDAREALGETLPAD